VLKKVGEPPRNRIENPLIIENPQIKSRRERAKTPNNCTKNEIRYAIPRDCEARLSLNCGPFDDSRTDP
jgi:hypothetical protein